MRVLYVSSHESLTRDVLGVLGAEAVAPLSRGDVPTAEVSLEDTDVTLLLSHDVEHAVTAIQHHYIHLILLDLRRGDGALELGRELLDALDHNTDLEARYGFHRILVLLPDERACDQALLELGATGVRHARRCSEDDFGAHTQEAFSETMRLIRARPDSIRALCAAGGGITGIYFEIGALKCLSDCIGEAALHDFDMSFGISAGAVVTGVLAAGFTVDELMASIAGVEGGRIPPLSLKLFRVEHLNLPDIQLRIRAAARGVRGALRAMLRERRSPSLSNALLEYTALVGAPFRSDHFERILRELFESSPCRNDFRRLKRPLYIGASDQDSKRHVLFGAHGLDHIPMSRAIQASLSINPAFSAVPIEGRFYEDGAVTRTSDFVEAVDRGANLVFVLDPFVPYVSRRVGGNHERGMLYNIDQDIRTMTYTRFASTRNHVLRQHPEVSSYTFLPSNTLRGLLSINPMDHRPFLAIWRGAYLSTLSRIEALRHRLRGDLIAHGITLELDRAREVAARLRATPVPTLADFFPEGRVELNLNASVDSRRS